MAFRYSRASVHGSSDCLPPHAPPCPCTLGPAKIPACPPAELTAYIVPMNTKPSARPMPNPTSRKASSRPRVTLRPLPPSAAKVCGARPLFFPMPTARRRSSPPRGLLCWKLQRLLNMRMACWPLCLSEWEEKQAQQVGAGSSDSRRENRRRHQGLDQQHVATRRCQIQRQQPTLELVGAPCRPQLHSSGLPSGTSAPGACIFSSRFTAYHKISSDRARAPKVVCSSVCCRAAKFLPAGRAIWPGRPIRGPSIPGCSAWIENSFRSQPLICFEAPPRNPTCCVPSPAPWRRSSRS